MGRDQSWAEAAQERGTEGGRTGLPRLTLTVHPAPQGVHVAGPVPAAGISPSTPGHSEPRPQTAAPLPQLVTAPSHPHGNASHPVGPQTLPISFVGLSAPPSLLSLPSLWQPGGLILTCRSDPIVCPPPICPSSSWPEDMAIVCLLKPTGTSMQSRVLSCLRVLHSLFPLPGILSFSAAISLANCYFSSETHLLQEAFPDLSMNLNLPYCQPPRPSSPEAIHASAEALSKALESSNCKSSFPPSAAWA